MGSRVRPRTWRQPTALLEEARTAMALLEACTTTAADGSMDSVAFIGPGGGWPTLTKTNYVEWAAVMKVRL